MERLDNGWFKFDFEMTDGTHTYRDAVHLPPDHNYTIEEIEAIKKERFNKWLELINTPPKEILVAPDPVIPTPTPVVEPVTDNIIDVVAKEVNG